MAKAAAAAAPIPTGEEAPKKSKKKLIIIIAALVILLAAGGAGAFFFLGSKGDAAHEEAKKEEHLGPPVFTVLDPFVVNLAEPDSTRYLQIGITYELKDPKVAEQVKNYTPVIRSRILIVLSGKNVSDLTSVEGKQRLMDELVDLARVTIHTEGNKDPTAGVRDVHFSSFVIQ